MLFRSPGYDAPVRFATVILLARPCVDAYHGGALGNPWIFSEALAFGDNSDIPTGLTPLVQGGDSYLAPTLHDKAAMFLKHARLTAEDKGERTAVLEMRKHTGWYFKGLPGSSRLRACVNTIKSLEALIAEVESYAESFQ